MLRISLLVRSLPPVLATARVAIRRWQMRRWLKRNRDRIALIATLARDAHELSELGLRVRAETLRELQDKLLDPGLRDLDPRNSSAG